MMRFLAGMILLFMFSGISFATELTIGLIPEQNVFKQVERYKPVGDYIERKTGIRIRFAILSRYGNIIERFKAEKMDGAFFGSFTGALAIEKLDVEPVARPVNLDGFSTYRGYIFVRRDSGIKNVSQMKGKRLVFVERATTAGYVYPVAYFKSRGVESLGRYFKEYHFAGSHDAAIYAVLNKKADIGCAKHSMFDRMARSDPRIGSELAILAQSPDVPSNGLCVRKDLDGGVKKQLGDVLVNMERDPEGKEILKKFEAMRFIPTTKEDYKPVSDIARDAGIDIKSYTYVNQ